MTTASYEFEGAAGRIHVTTWAGDEEARFTTLLAHGYGRSGTRRIVEATVMVEDEGSRLVSWREVR